MKTKQVNSHIEEYYRLKMERSLERRSNRKEFFKYLQKFSLLVAGMSVALAIGLGITGGIIFFFRNLDEKTGFTNVEERIKKLEDQSTIQRDYFYFAGTNGVLTLRPK